MYIAFAFYLADTFIQNDVQSNAFQGHKTNNQTGSDTVQFKDDWL